MSHRKFDEAATLRKLSHYLPHQAPLKDFVHHNTLSAFEDIKFENAIHTASRIFGYKVSLSINEYKWLYKKHKIREDVLERVILERQGEENADEWIHNLFHKEYDDSNPQRIGLLRAKWKKKLGIDFNAEVHSRLFKILAAYLDQGIALWRFPASENGFLAALRLLEADSFVHICHTKRARQLLADDGTSLKGLLDLLVGEEQLFEQYLFDQQFAHPGWSGLVTVVEHHPETLMDTRKISLRDVVMLELILEIDVLDSHFGNKWNPLQHYIKNPPPPLFEPILPSEKSEVIGIWQEAYEWSFYDEVLAGITKMKGKSDSKKDKTFQALFCIDDREESMRRHLESIDNRCETFGTPGFFGVAFYYQPIGGKFYTKVCPAPVTPTHLIKETGTGTSVGRDIHFSKKTHTPLLGALLSLTLGFLSAFRLFVNIFKPSLSSAAAYSFSHMNKTSGLTIENTDSNDIQDGLQVGFTVSEMTDRVEKVLRSIGLVTDFSEMVYVIGHGSSSINNTHYAGYDCGACSGRPGSVNARVFCFMANHPKVRELLRQRGIEIPDSTEFVGGLHDTTRDEIAFYDEENFSPRQKQIHAHYLKTFEMALDMNAKERSRRFMSIETKRPATKVHQSIRNRSVSLFEPRPELNHATNALCVVGRHSLCEGLFLDRRAFANSYNFRLDPNGDLLLEILGAATPVCGGINLEYYFSRVDAQKLGAGSKLPHNVMGLVGVSNGVEGDLRPGLPYQMTEMHDPLRLLMIVEHYPQVVLATIKRNPAVYRWYINEWVNLVAVHPETCQIYRFKNGEFVHYEPLKHLLDTVYDVNALLESGDQNLPIYLIKKR